MRIREWNGEAACACGACGGGERRGGAGGELLCTSPPVAKEAAGTVAVRVVLNGDADVLHELTESVEFRYFAL